MKKAMPTKLKHLSKNTGEPLCSGHTVSGVAEKVLDEMHAILGRGSHSPLDMTLDDEEVDDAADDEEETTTNNRPANPKK